LCCRNLSYNIHVSAVAYQMAPTCSKQMNLLYFADIQLILYWAIVQHQIQQGITGVQIAALKLKQPNLD